MLNRTTRCVAPTEAGEQILSRLRPLLADFAAVVDSVNAFRNKPAGHLRLTVPPHVGSFFLAPLSRAFTRSALTWCWKYPSTPILSTSLRIASMPEFALTSVWRAT